MQSGATRFDENQYAIAHRLVSCAHLKINRTRQNNSCSHSPRSKYKDVSCWVDCNYKKLKTNKQIKLAKFPQLKNICIQWNR